MTVASGRTKLSLCCIFYGLEGSDQFLYTSDIPHSYGEFPKNLKYLWNHPEVSQKTKEKSAYHNGKEYFELDCPASAWVAGKRTEITIYFIKN